MRFFYFRIGLFWLGLTLVVLSFQGCKKEVDIPAYIEINSYSLQITNNEQGSASAAINTVWVYANDNPVGVFDVPCKFPVTTLGNVKLTLVAGVKVNGISSSRVQYPNLEQFIINVNLIADSTYQVNPITKYYPDIKFPFLEDFEDPGLLFQTTSVSDGGLFINKTSNLNEVFEGSGSGKVTIGADKLIFECANTKLLDLPTNTTPVFLEMNYKTNNDLRVGIYAETTVGINQLEIAGFNPTDTWKKVYVYLTPALTQYSGGKFKIYLGVPRNTSSPDEIVAYFDNIKIVHP